MYFKSSTMLEFWIRIQNRVWFRLRFGYMLLLRMKDILSFFTVLFHIFVPIRMKWIVSCSINGMHNGKCRKRINKIMKFSNIPFTWYIFFTFIPLRFRCCVISIFFFSHSAISKMRAKNNGKINKTQQGTQNKRTNVAFERLSGTKEWRMASWQQILYYY